ncbi:NAD(P)/FAD-dependent oxidoreductase [Gudongella sp. DL1XJH-153]|uniref:NAD(P)/FAD-dependent oxidoreductase n=1 Tax=Gudongella sp. DL1XJH-153 TaxID=3409804 RepID=UPI003BB4D782
MLRIAGIRLSLDQDESTIASEIAKKLKIRETDIVSWKIWKKSVDARRKNNITFVYSIDFNAVNEREILKRHGKKGVSQATAEDRQYLRKENINGARPVIVGTGPSGLFAGMVLAEMGYSPILLERGKKVEERVKDVREFWNTGVLNTESNVQFGEGGAGTFSDGKLTTMTNDPRSRKVLEYFVEAGAPEDILYVNKPHIGTDILRRVVINLRKKIISLGGEVRFQSKMTGLEIRDGKIVAVIVNNQDSIVTDKVVLALGHSARDTFELLYDKGLNIQQKSFSIGVRIEHPQKLVDLAQYGQSHGHPRLGAADYKLAGHFDGGRSAYTFCMCPGGTVVAAASEEGMLVTNGMSEHARNRQNANAALLVNVGPEDFNSDHPLAGVYFQREWEKKAYQEGGGGYLAPAQRVGDFLEGRPSSDFGSVSPSYRPGVKMTDLRLCLPEYVTSTLRKAILDFDKKLKGFADPDALMTGVETRSSSPIRIVRGEEHQSNISGIYPTGEGAGYAGGIISAAVDGIRIAESIEEEEEIG